MPETSNTRSSSNDIDELIRRRSTTKVMLPPERRADREAAWTAGHHEALCSMVETAVWAPFHRRAHEVTHRGGNMNSPVPWRFHIVEGAACTRLLEFLCSQAESQPDSKWSRAWQSKIKEMLAACGALLQATWLPDPSANDAPASADHGMPELTMNNMEHIAAAGAAVQNLLLAADSREWQSYWSSGGILREPEVFDYLGIDRSQVLIGAIFLNPQLIDAAREIPGGLREERGELGSWARWVEL